MRNLCFLLVGLACLALLPEFAFSQNQTISGRITDAGGNPVGGASIVIKMVDPHLIAIICSKRVKIENNLI